MNDTRDNSKNEPDGTKSDPALMARDARRRRHAEAARRKKKYLLPAPTQEGQVPRRKHVKGSTRHGQPFRAQDFETYAIWCSLPAILRGQAEPSLQALGLNDPITLDLLTIRTQGEFARRFQVDPATLTLWNARPDLWRRVDKARTGWARRLTSNAYSALYKGLLKEGDASRFKIWMQVVEGWIEKTQTRQANAQGGDLFQNLSGISDAELDTRIQAIQARIGKDKKQGGSGK